MVKGGTFLYEVSLSRSRLVSSLVLYQGTSLGLVRDSTVTRTPTRGLSGAHKENRGRSSEVRIKHEKVTV